MQQQEAQLLQEQQEQHQKIEAQVTRRHQLDRGVWLKTRRLTHKWQDEQRLDMSVLQQQVTQETDEKQEAAQRKVNTPEFCCLGGETNLPCQNSTLTVRVLHLKLFFHTRAL